MGYYNNMLFARNKNYKRKKCVDCNDKYDPSIEGNILRCRICSSIHDSYIEHLEENKEYFEYKNDLYNKKLLNNYIFDIIFYNKWNNNYDIKKRHNDEINEKKDFDNWLDNIIK